MALRTRLFWSRNCAELATEVTDIAVRPARQHPCRGGVLLGPTQREPQSGDVRLQAR